jgi:hypothetical protein
VRCPPRILGLHLTRCGELPAHRQPAIPFAVDPPTVGAGRRLGRHVKQTLTRVRTLAARAVVCSACPGRRWAGWPRATTHPARPAYGPLHPGARAPPPEAPTADRNPRYGAAWLPRRAPARRRLPAADPPRSSALGAVVSAASGASRYPRQPMGVGVTTQSDSGSVGARPIGGASGPSRAALTDDGETRQVRGLKHRADTEIRPIPIPPELVKLLRDHIDRDGVTEDGRFFRAARGGHLSESAYGRVWRDARAKALTPEQAASPLAGRPYDLRHAAVSLWLNGGVPATEVARRAGHGVAVLLRVYAGCIDGEEELVNKRIERALRASRSRGRIGGKTP